MTAPDIPVEPGALGDELEELAAGLASGALHTDPDALPRARRVIHDAYAAGWNETPMAGWHEGE